LRHKDHLAGLERRHICSASDETTKEDTGTEEELRFAELWQIH